MSKKSSSQKSKQQNKDNRQPVVLSKDEAFYPPSPKALKITIGAMIVAIIFVVIMFILFPLPI